MLGIKAGGADAARGMEARGAFKGRWRIKEVEGGRPAGLQGGEPHEQASCGGSCGREEPESAAGAQECRLEREGGPAGRRWALLLNAGQKPGLVMKRDPKRISTWPTMWISRSNSPGAYFKAA